MLLEHLNGRIVLYSSPSVVELETGNMIMVNGAISPIPKDIYFRKTAVPIEELRHAFWCGIVQNDNRIEIPGRHKYDWQDIVYVTPENANMIFISDYAMLERIAEDESKKEHRYCIRETMRKMYQAFLDTLIPIEAYLGTFEKPVILICRDINRNEISYI